MIYPPLKDLLSRVDSKYALVVMVAKRARQLAEGEPSLVSNIPSNNPVTIAACEIAQGKITYERIK
ncbi:DNA-directed RNA polymerase subunit omega [Mahella australiensis]|jgi:DNA-directed RNA polymerase subunit omega|uniref:DNA-directed RNA polymerase subunit omega n=1 Tax=Mahella australiensis (strain DSM 15567 / CIP 107919 / 50-1 BON) TaxID=697281 RepID=F4A2D1_MAHA5|nr:DNA-directed RNA polymerase subunit omega [Mahella australiensis]AEE96178.1 DNA-directed RNA polymerase subunit omega [Mahella australiensis 50-1 BON]